MNERKNEHARTLGYRVRDDGQVEVDFDVAVDRRLTVTMSMLAWLTLDARSAAQTVAAIEELGTYPRRPAGEV